MRLAYEDREGTRLLLPLLLLLLLLRGAAWEGMKVGLGGARVLGMAGGMLPWLRNALASVGGRCLAVLLEDLAGGGQLKVVVRGGGDLLSLTVSGCAGGVLPCDLLLPMWLLLAARPHWSPLALCISEHADAGAGRR